MRPIFWRIILGAFLLVIGVVTLLQTLNVVNFEGGFWPIFFAILFLVAGLAFLWGLFQNRTNWWAAIPGMTLLSIGLLIIINEVVPAFAPLGGSLVLGGIGLSFWLVYLMAPQNWWAIIPGGTMVTLAVVAGVGSTSGADGGGILFLGLAVTFGLLALLPVGGRKMAWPWIPAAVCLVLGILISVSSAGGAANFIWPVALILLGIFFLTRNLFKKSE